MNNFKLFKKDKKCFKKTLTAILLIWYDLVKLKVGGKMTDVEDAFKDLVVVKRSGQRVDFNSNKIAIAIKKAFDNTRQDNSEKEINKVYEDVLKYINSSYTDRKTINVEDIQDIIETKLKENKYDDVYYAFSDYRIRRAASRKAFGVKQQHKFAKAIERIANSNKETFNGKPNEILLDFGKTISSEYTKTYVLDNKLVRAHEEGSIYIHNLDYFNLGKLSATHMLFSHVINDDFPSSFILEALDAKNEIDGEIAIDSIDYLLEDLVIKRFKKNYQQLLQKYLDVCGILEYLNYKKISEIIEKSESINFDLEIFNPYILNKKVKDIFEICYNDSMEYVLEKLELNFQTILTSLNNNYKENKKYSISLGSNNSFEGLMISNAYLKVLSKLDRLENVTTIFKVKKDSSQELMNKASELVINDKNIAFSFTDNSYNKEGNALVEYFSDGKRIFENPVYDEVGSLGRMIISTVSINIGRLGLKYNGKDRKELYSELDELLDLSKNALTSIFETIGDKNRDNYQIIFNHNIIDDDKLEPGQKIRKVIKKGTLNIELVGLYEGAKCLEQDESKIEEVIYNIISYVNDKAKKYTQESNLNFVVSETSKYRPLRKLMELDKAIYGIRKGITDKNCYERIDSIAKEKGDVKEYLSYLGKCQRLLTGGAYTLINIAKNTSQKKIIEYLNIALDVDVGFIKFSVRK